MKENNDVEKKVWIRNSGTEGFKQLGLNEDILSAIKRLDFESPSEIQEKSIPLVLSGKDVIAKSATGSGKTLAFGAGILKKVTRGSGVQALVLTPTRELANQVAEHLKTFSMHHNPLITCVYGGISMIPQINSLKRADIVVGTPGRIFDHLRKKTLNLGKIKVLVLDEADRMVDMGFIHDVERIIGFCNKNRQTLLFSATLSKDIDYIAKKYMNNPIKVSAEAQVDPSKLYQTYYDITSDLKFSLLVHLLKLERNGVVMVFCNTRREASRVANNLQKNGVDALAIHGGLSQNKRDSVLRAFRSRDTFIMVCTDVAARGLDIQGVTHIYNYDIPKVSSDYIHRIGRTARAGKDGIAITFVSQGNHGEFNQVLRDTSFKIERLTVPKIERIVNNPGLNKSHSSSRNQRNQREQGNERDQRDKRKIGKSYIGHRARSLKGNNRMSERRKKRDRRAGNWNRSPNRQRRRR